MAETRPFAHRAYVPHVRGADEHLRVTYHEAEGVVVVSHWHGAVCTAATPVDVRATGPLVALLGQALAHAASHPAAAPPAEPERPLAWWRRWLGRLGPRTSGPAPGPPPSTGDADVVPLRWRSTG